MKRWSWMLSAVVFVAAPATAAAPTLSLRLEGPGPYYTLDLPLAWQAQAGDLRGLQLLNARNEPLPYAWVDAPPPQSTQQTAAVPFFRLPEPKPARKGEPEPKPDGAPRGWVLDLRAMKGRALVLNLALRESAQGAYPIDIEASDDLQHWRSVRPGAQLVWLQRGGERLASDSFELGGVQAGYLRLRSPASGPVPEITGAEVTSTTELRVPPVLQWTEPIAPSQCDVRQCDYTLPAVPVEQVELLLQDADTVSRVTWLGRVDATSPVPSSHRHHLLRRPLHALRDKRQAADSTPGWEFLGEGSAYWLRTPQQGELKSPPLRLDAGTYPQLRLQPAGGVAQWGAKPPLLRVGTHTRTLVLLARGAGPVRLRTVDPGQALAPMSLAELMPARPAGEALPVDRAVVSAEAVPVAAAPSAMPPKPVTAPPVPRGWLWAALAAGVALMGAMAWSLLRGR